MGERVGIAVLLTMLGAASGWVVVGSPFESGSLTYDASVLKEGDVVVARGDSWRSRIVVALEAGRSQYSHIGVVNSSEGRMTVVHATPERDSDSESGAVIEEPIDKFFATGEYLQAAVYRPAKVSWSTRRSAVRSATQLADAGTPFDDQFDLTSSNQIYCTELVWRAYKSAGIQLVNPTDAEEDIILPSEIIQNPMFSRVDEFGQ